MLVGRRSDSDDPAAVDAMCAQRPERRLGGGVAPDAARDRGAHLLAREIDRDIGRASSGLGGNVVDCEQLPGLGQRLDRSAQHVRDEDPGAADLNHHALPGRAQRRQTFEHRLAHRAPSGDHDVLRSAHAEQRVRVRLVGRQRTSHGGQIALLEDRAVIHFGHPDRDRLAQQVVGDAGAAVQHERNVDGAPDCLQVVEVERRPAGKRDMDVADADGEKVDAGRAHEVAGAHRVGLLALAMRKGWMACRQFAELGLDGDVMLLRIVDQIAHPLDDRRRRTPPGPPA